MSNRKRGFTLIELMLVILIIGILAAMSLPLVAAAQHDVKRTSVDATVHETQKAINLYLMKAGRLPDLTSNWNALTAPSVDSSGRPMGPFLSMTPRNVMAMGHESLVVDSATEVSSALAAFSYDYAAGNGTGRLIAAIRH